MTMSRALVAMQFVLAGLVLLRFRPALAGAGFALFLLTGIVVGLWALSANRPGNFNIRPEPKEGGILVMRGPYRWVRHPMYLAVLLFTAAFAIAGDAWQWVAWAALGLVLLAKARREERGLDLAHPGYADYRARTRAIIPFVI
jgi:protein-S-isoprenylcysteine O-methyltransferase Ste14